uniref:Uncharacterized protein n=1 Tax=Timema monikensis TaxID=170555 RepID=A0A7R9HJL0_9NEOP|nr:unnamed protein product [Timema monikensis]
MAEQRRKQVQELELKIANLMKKIQEQANIIKMKGKSDEKITILQNEIQTMKQIKVRLIRQMKAESEKFKLWKQERERELIKLKDQDRKRQNQIVKMERLHAKQQNVLKRKVEEAVAINKRLKKERPCLLPPTPLRKVKGLCPLEGSAFPPARAQPLAYIPPLRIGAFLPRGSPFLGLLDLIIDACRAVHKNKE